MKKQLHIQDQVLWYINRGNSAPCTQDMQVDVVIIGGGMAGLSAAQAWQKRGKKVVLLEQSYCGAGASGKSSGFITPNAELSLTDFAHRYNMQAARSIWDFFSAGVEDIRSNILENNFVCEYKPEDTLVVANSVKALKELAVEHNNLEKLGYQSKFYTQDSIRSQIGSNKYFGGVGYENSFGINGYQYCQQLKSHLQSLGVLIFEETPVLSVNDHEVITAHAKISADFIVVCTDRFMPELQMLKQEVYQVQTFLMASQVLSDEQVKTIFPDKDLMVWDTDFIYNYFRITSEKRLLLGGGNMVSAYVSKATHDYAPIVQHLTSYLAEKFPSADIEFEFMWPGLIGLSKDIVPLAGRDKNKPYLYYVSGAAGLPIAAALGRYSAENLVDGNHDLDDYFSPYRKFPISGVAQSILGKKLSFALSNLITKKVS